MAINVGEAEVEAAARELDPHIFRDIPHFVSPIGLTLERERDGVRRRARSILAAARSASSSQDGGEALRTLHQVLAPRFSRLLSIARELRRRAIAAERERDEARAVLRRCEEGLSWCPECAVHLDHGISHAPGCTLAAALDPPPRGATGPSVTPDATSSEEGGHGRG